MQLAGNTKDISPAESEEKSALSERASPSISAAPTAMDRQRTSVTAMMMRLAPSTENGMKNILKMQQENIEIQEQIRRIEECTRVVTSKSSRGKAVDIAAIVGDLMPCLDDGQGDEQRALRQQIRRLQQQLRRKRLAWTNPAFPALVRSARVGASGGKTQAALTGAPAGMGLGGAQPPLRPRLSLIPALMPLPPNAVQTLSSRVEAEVSTPSSFPLTDGDAGPSSAFERVRLQLVGVAAPRRNTRVLTETLVDAVSNVVPPLSEQA